MVGINTSQVMSQIEGIVDAEIGKFLAEVQGIMRRAYEKIVFESPVITAYYQTNHSIVIRGSGGQFRTQGARLSPGDKLSEEPLFYVENLDGRMAEELEKLSRYVLGDTIEISTIVPYADAVEAKHNVYGSAAAAYDLDYEP